MLKYNEMGKTIPLLMVQKRNEYFTYNKFMFIFKYA